MHCGFAKVSLQRHRFKIGSQASCGLAPSQLALAHLIVPWPAVHLACASTPCLGCRMVRHTLDMAEYLDTKDKHFTNKRDDPTEMQEPYEV